MHTEEEAKKLWCPHYRSNVSISAYGDARDYDSNRNSKEFIDVDQPTCIASKCMAWRWVQELKIYDEQFVDYDELSEPGDGQMWRLKPGSAVMMPERRGTYQLVAPLKEGFCGLAGQP